MCEQEVADRPHTIAPHKRRIFPRGINDVVVQQTEPMFLGRYLRNTLPSVSSRAVSLPGSINACMIALIGSGLGMSAGTSGAVHSEPCDLYVNSNSKCGLTASGDGQYYITNGAFGMPSLSGCVSGRWREAFVLDPFKPARGFGRRRPPISAGAGQTCNCRRSLRKGTGWARSKAKAASI